jgi:hypothetical protein
LFVDDDTLAYTPRMRSTSAFCFSVLCLLRAGDLVAKNEASAASFVGPPDHCPAGLRRSRTPPLGGLGRQFPTMCS